MAGMGRIESDDTTRWSSFDGVSSQDHETTACVDDGSAAGDGQGASVDRLASPYAEVGVTPSGDGVYAGAAVLKGRDAKSGVGVEIMGVSGQAGAQNEVSWTEARLSASATLPAHVSGTIDVLTAHAGVGTHNADGSRGLNVGMTGIGVGAEGTVEISGWSGTLGASLGLGAEASVGLRDADHDGRAEICARAVFAWWTVGGCAELPFESRALIPDDGRSDP